MAKIQFTFEVLVEVQTLGELTSESVVKAEDATIKKMVEAKSHFDLSFRTAGWKIIPTEEVKRSDS